MKTYYYSEILNNYFKTEQDCFNAEKKHIEDLDKAKKTQQAEKEKQEELKNKRKLRAKEVEEAFTKAREAEVYANKLLTNFLKEYDVYYTTIKDTDTLYNGIFKWFLGHN